MKPNQTPDDARAASGHTLPSRETASEPRLPHERDESTDSQSRVSDAAKKFGDQAFADLQSGKVDTDRGPPADRAYQAQRQPGPKPDTRQGQPHEAAPGTRRK
jgi:hypothetical protein